MNQNCYKIIFSKRLNSLVVVGENASSSTKSPGNSNASKISKNIGSTKPVIRFVGALASVYGMMLNAWAGNPISSSALPNGATVASGSVSMTQTGNTLTINQSTSQAIVNWQNFDIGSSAKVQINQPNASSVQLDRVNSINPTQIFGQLNSNGSVLLELMLI